MAEYEGKSIEQLQKLHATQRDKRSAAKQEMHDIEVVLEPLLNKRGAKTKLARAGLSEAEMASMSGDGNG